MLDFDIAEMYEVETRALKQAIRRNMERFPADFMFILTKDEWHELITNCDNLPEAVKYSPSLPFALTEHGVTMLSSVLRSDKAINVSINIVRAFIAVREYILFRATESVEIAQLKERVLRLEYKSTQLEQSTDENIGAINDLSEDMGKELDTIYEAIGALSVKLPQLDKPRRNIGFKQGDE